MTHGSLFSGIGGFDLAAEWMGWDNIFHCEWNPFGQQILKDYWPKAIIYEDITKTDFTIHRGRIDILTGGFPCQPYSASGKRKGKEDERHLWPEMLRAIREIKPTWVVGENVFGLVNWSGGLVFEEVQTDLEAEGYEVQPYVLPAAGVGAPHRRDRVWFVAYSNTIGFQRGEDGLCNKNEWKIYPDKQNNRHEIRGKIGGRCSLITNTANTRPKNMQFRWKNRIHKLVSSSDPEMCDEQWARLCGEFKQRQIRRSHRANDVADTVSIGLRGQGDGPGETRLFDFQGPDYDWRNFPTQPPVCNGNDGLSTESLRQRIREDSMGHLSKKEIDKILSKAAIEWRKESIKGGGNAIVPHVGYQIFKTIEAYQNLIH